MKHRYICDNCNFEITMNKNNWTILECPKCGSKMVLAEGKKLDQYQDRTIRSVKDSTWIDLKGIAAKNNLTMAQALKLLVDVNK